jgi:hypothetical protein
MIRAGKRTYQGFIGRGAALALGINERTLQRLVDAGLIETAEIPNTLGRGRTKTGFKKNDILIFLGKSAQAFDGFYPDGRINLSRAAKDSGLPRNFLYQCTKKGMCYYRADGRLPSLLQKRPIGSGRRGKAERTVWPEDVTALKRAIAEAERQVIPDGEWADVKDLAARYGVHVGRLGPLLRGLRQTNPTSAIRIWWDRRGQWRQVWLYQVERIDKAIRNDQDAADNNLETRLHHPDNGLSAEQEDRTHQQRERPEREKHLRWKKWHEEEGLSYQQIANRHQRRYDEVITRDAVAKALRRLSEGL